MRDKQHGISCAIKSSTGVVLMLIAFLLYSCNEYPGFEKQESGIFLRLDRFGDCEPPLATASHFVMDVSYHPVETPDSGYRFQLYHHGIHHITPGNQDEQPGLRLMSVLDSMDCGDQVTLILPFSEINNSFISAYADSSSYGKDALIELQLHVLQTFSEREFARFLMHASQQEELTEPEAIELLLMNDVFTSFEKHGLCFLQYKKNTAGDSILAGREITIRYNTFLLDGTQLDETTDMQFSFGKPGQIISGLQYGLSFLQEGDVASIYLPSALAFGENGNSNHIVPPHTPIYFQVEVLAVSAPEEN